MSGSLVRKIGGESAIGYGVNIWELTPPGRVSGVKTNVVGVVAALPWGPTTVQRITSTGALFDTYCPPAFDAAEDYTALRAFLNKVFAGGLRIVRAVASDAVAATKTFDDASNGDSVDVDAKYVGVLGNSIKVAWTANADDGTARDATVSIGTAYSKTYKRVATIVSAALVVTDPGDPYVTFSKASGATLVPAAIAATSLASGSDGTIAAADFVGAGNSSVGIRKFYAESVDIDVLFVAEAPTAMVDDINDGLEAYVQATDKGMAVLCTVPDQTVANAITYVADYRDDRLVYAWPRVKTKNMYASDLAEIEVDGNAFVAAAIVAVDPEKSPGGPSNASVLSGITGLEDEDASTTDLDDLNDAGVMPFMITSKFGAILRRAVTTSLTSGLEKVFRRRMTDYIVESIADRLQAFVEQPLDLDLATQTLGAITGAEVSEIHAFLSDLKQKGRIKDYSVDAFSGNTETNIDEGTWIILLSVELFSMQEAIVLKANIGEGVEIAEA